MIIREVQNFCSDATECHSHRFVFVLRDEYAILWYGEGNTNIYMLDDACKYHYHNHL